MFGQHPLQLGPHRLEVEHAFQHDRLTLARLLGQRRRHDVRDQPCVRPLRRHRALRDPRQRRQRRLDLAELDPHAADLDLLVGPPEELQRPVGPPARQIAGAVEPRPRHARERVGHEALRRQPRPAEIAAPDLHAADQQLAHHPHRLRLEPPIHNVDLRVGDRTADRNRALTGPDFMDETVAICLRRAVEVDEPHRRIGGSEPVDEGPRQLLTTADHQPQCREIGMVLQTPASTLGTNVNRVMPCVAATHPGPPDQSLPVRSRRRPAPRRSGPSSSVMASSKAGAVLARATLAALIGLGAPEPREPVQQAAMCVAHPLGLFRSSPRCRSRRRGCRARAPRALGLAQRRIGLRRDRRRGRRLVEHHHAARPARQRRPRCAACARVVSTTGAAASASMNPSRSAG